MNKVLRVKPVDLVYLARLVMMHLRQSFRLVNRAPEDILAITGKLVPLVLTYTK